MSSRLKLNFFTPLPPLETDIANFSVAVLRELSLLAEVRVWTSQATWHENLGDGLEIHRFDPKALDIRTLNRADMTFYNMGNNTKFHAAIFDVARLIPGIVILHDTHLSDFFFGYGTKAGESRYYYLSEIEALYGSEAATHIQNALWGVSGAFDFVETYSMVMAAINTGIGSITHNSGDYDLLTKTTKLPVYYLPLPFDYSSAAPDQSPLTGERPTRLVAFGYIGSNRRLLQILTAIAERPDRQDFTLDLYGQIDNLEEIKKTIAELDLGEIVRWHGFVAESELNAALARADLALNLRFPTRGEASGSQLRIWAAGLPALVTRVGWYGLLPQDTVFFVDPEREIVDIQSHLTAIRKDPARFRAAGLRGRAQLEKYHHPHDYAAGLVKIAEDARLQHACRGARSLAQDAAQAMATLFGVDHANSIAPFIAKAIHEIVTPDLPRSPRKS